MSDRQSTKDLIARWQLGDRAAGDELYDRFAAALRRFAGKMLGARLRQQGIESQELVDSAFASWLRRLDHRQYEHRDSRRLLNYLATVLLNKIRGAAARARGTATVDAAPEPTDPAPSPAQALEEDDHMNGFLARLSPRQHVIAVAVLDGLSVEEIADRAGCSRWTVRRELNEMGRHLCRAGRPDRQEAQPDRCTQAECLRT